VSYKNPPKESQWKPGQSGNPAGYSRGRRAVDDLLDLIREKNSDRTIAEKWLNCMLEGDFRYMKEYLERRDGKVQDAPSADQAAAMEDVESLRDHLNRRHRKSR
jgi:hypothetical protein